MQTGCIPRAASNWTLWLISPFKNDFLSSKEEEDEEKWEGEEEEIKNIKREMESWILKCENRVYVGL